VSESEEAVLYEARGTTAVVTLNRPRYRNAQNSIMTYALDGALHRAAMDDAVRVIVLRGAGDHFSAGHDIGSPGRDIDVSYPRTTMWPDHVGKPGVESRLNRESEVYLELVRRWRDLPKPTIAMVHGACVAGALMLAWACDLLIASDDAFFADPVVRMGAPGVEYFAHPFQMAPRLTKEFLFLGDRMPAARAHEVGMVNRVVPRAHLDTVTFAIADRIAAMPPMALTLAKKAINFAEDEMGLRASIDHSFGLHQLAHAHSAEISGGDAIMGVTPRSMKASAEGRAGPG
jgi:enoyl-CoA hydratase/carnithine racemase